MSAQPFYLDVDGRPVYAVFHPGESEGDGPAVLLCPLLGWEELASRRPRRDWAEHLAARGHPTLRFDLPGSGDSAGGPDDPGLVDAWVAAVDAAARWLATTSGRRIAAVGMGLGGQLALLAAGAGAPIDEAVLWGVPAHGKAVHRELRTFARVEAAMIVAAGAPEAPPLEGESIAPGGFLVSGQTVAALKGLDARVERVPERVLLLERDGLAVDDELRAHLEARGAQVVSAPGPGYAAMVEAPASAQEPAGVYGAVDVWLAEPRGPAAHRVEPPRTLAALELDGVRERPFAVETPRGRLAGVLAEPAGRAREPLTAVLLNAGAIPRIGPNRMWVEIARRWAANGVATLRIDLTGIGDADGTSGLYADVVGLYEGDFLGEIRAAFDALEADGQPGRFVVGGLCSGAFWSFQAAAEDARVAQALPINSAYFVFDLDLEGARTLTRIRRRLFHAPSWRRLLRGDFELRTATTLRALIRRVRADDRTLIAGFDRLRERGTRLDMIFCDGEPLREEVAALGKLDAWPNVTVEVLPGRDHMFRPVWMHEHLHAAVDRALARALDSERARADRGAVPTPVGDGRAERHP